MHHTKNTLRQSSSQLVEDKQFKHWNIRRLLEQFCQKVMLLFAQPVVLVLVNYWSISFRDKDVNFACSSCCSSTSSSIGTDCGVLCSIPSWFQDTVRDRMNKYVYIHTYLLVQYWQQQWSTCGGDEVWCRLSAIAPSKSLDIDNRNTQYRQY